MTGYRFCLLRKPPQCLGIELAGLVNLCLDARPIQFMMILTVMSFIIDAYFSRNYRDRSPYAPYLQGLSLQHVRPTMIENSNSVDWFGALTVGFARANASPGASAAISLGFDKSIRCTTHILTSHMYELSRA